MNITLISFLFFTSLVFVVVLFIVNLGLLNRSEWRIIQKALVFIYGAFALVSLAMACYIASNNKMIDWDSLIIFAVSLCLFKVYKDAKPYPYKDS